MKISLNFVVIMLCLVVGLQAQNNNKRHRPGGYRELTAEKISNARVQNVIRVGRDFLSTNTSIAPCRESLAITKVESRSVRNPSYKLTYIIQANPSCTNQSNIVGQTCTVIVVNNVQKNKAQARQGNCQ